MTLEAMLILTQLIFVCFLFYIIHKYFNKDI